MAERDGVRLWCRAKLVAYGAIAVWLAAESPFPDAFWFLGTIAVFAAMAVTLILISRKPWFSDWISYGCAGAEAVICVVVLMTPNPFHAMDIPMTDMLRFTPMPYLFVFLASASPSARPPSTAATASTSPPTRSPISISGTIRSTMGNLSTMSPG